MKITLNQIAFTLLLSASPLFVGCKGDTGPAGAAGAEGPPAPPVITDPDLHPTEDGPGINISILSVDGASGLDGTFQVGDPVSITFEVKKDDGDDWMLSEFRRGRALVSGPTFNYQRVIPEETHVADMAVDNGDGTWTFTFDETVPATYLAPFNDTTAFDATDGELTGMPLLAGTYTVGLYFTWRYNVDENTFDEVDNATEDVLFLGASTVETREVVGDMNCNACHDSLRAHGGQRQDVTICLMCHTAGSEDDNDGGLTPGVSVDFKVMIHKIHNGAFLPSVNGIATNPDGSRDYTATPEPYVLAGHSVADFSHVVFPRWPNLAYKMPEDLGYSALTSDEKALEDIQRSGVTDCAACHGDPDGAGPIPAPAQGMQAYEQPSQNACGSCHDDLDYARPYVQNTGGMPEDQDDSTCLLCHEPSGDPLATYDAHLHPMRDPAYNTGLNFLITGIEDAGLADDDDGTIDVGEKVEVTFTMTDDLGADVDPADLTRNIAVVLNGPTSNLNLVLSAEFDAAAALTGPQPYTINLPAPQYFERLATGTAGTDVFETDFTPLWDDKGEASSLVLRGADGAVTSLDGAAAMGQNYIDVADGSGFTKDDLIVIDDGLGAEEYLKVIWADGDRLWFGSAYQGGYKAGLAASHLDSADVRSFTAIPLTEGVDYSVNVAGSYTELIDAGAGAIVLASYTSDFVMPATYPVTFNDSPDVTEAWGKWAGKSIVDGTYRLGMWSETTVTVALHSETQNYPGTSVAGMADLLVGGASSFEPYDLIEEVESCYACHEDIYFHGGHRRGVEACIQCHGAAGGQDRPQYVAPGADPTTGTMIKFREMIHKIHQGADLDKADTYTVNGYGFAGAYPNNFTPHHYDEVVFPAFPGGTKHCEMCHGDSDAWEAPANLAHPAESLLPSQSWSISCGSCHDSDAAHAHIDAQTAPSGAESCAICHDDGSANDVEFVHNPRM